MADNSNSLGLLQSSAVKELANIGLGNAMTALSNLTGRYFDMTVPNIDTVNLDQIPELIDDPMGVSVGIYMPVEGDVCGHMAFLWPWSAGTSIWKMLVGSAPETPEGIDELYASTTLEIGNIIGSSFLNAISDMANLKLHATPPLFSLDHTASICSSVVAEAQLSEVTALFIETEIFEIENEASDVRGFFLFIPNKDGLDRIFDNLGIREAA